MALHFGSCCWHVGCLRLEHMWAQCCPLARSAPRPFMCCERPCLCYGRTFCAASLSLTARRDACRGHQVFLYKRAQIFVGDLWGAFKGGGLGAFDDIDRLTMCAGLPQVLVVACLASVAAIKRSSHRKHPPCLEFCPS